MRIEKADWNPVTEAFIASALSTASIEDIKLQAQNGAVLFAVIDDSENTVAAFVLRVDTLANFSQGVVVAAGGRADIDLTKHVLPAIERMFIDCKSVRIHTARVGLIKKLAGQGYRGGEIVLEKELNHGTQ
ncbi:hypothetical protein GCM10008066_06270 [Oxalicibacterium faecigallinarum]|uniref:Uncharacterized protein n=2 Tax=Oxalicibacterium faecigallinarum TaxID=573741 RepID=A0A8J3AQK3_9BURK|nr:hypothetical protein GCM10008066_06270 [Oxalicibacterium faecigallinarum]